MKKIDASSLITIRNYVVMSIDNHNLSREKINQLNKLKILLDKVITDYLISEDFISSLNIENAESVIKETLENNNLKKDMKSGFKFVVVDEGKAEVK